MAMTLKFNSLIDNVYNSINKDPNIFEVFQLTYSGVEATYRIVDATLRIESTDPVVDDFFIDLNQETLQSLVTLIEVNTRYTAALITDFAGVAELSACTLIEREKNRLSDSHEKKFFIHTSFLWSLFKATAKELEVSDVNFTAGLRQMNILTAEDIFLDHWGRDYYNEGRLPEEGDFDYSRRVIRTIIRPKVNDFALEDILAQVLLFDGDPLVDVKVRTHPTAYTNDYTNGRMIDVGNVNEAQSRNRDFDVAVARMIGTVGVEEVDFLTLPGGFDVTIITDGRTIPLTDAEIRAHLDRYKASGKRYRLRFRFVVDEGDYGPVIEDETVASNIFEEGVVYKQFWLIRDDYRTTRDDFDNSRSIYPHAQEDHDENP